jgi:hypothetical protein
MYRVNCRVRGVAPLLQHAFGAASLSTLMDGAKKQTGVTDYSLEWMATMYVNRDGLLVQPAAHLEGALVKAAASFKIKGRAGKTWKDPIKAYCYVSPDEIPHIWNGQYVLAPDASLIENPTENLSVSIMRVKVQQSAVARSRLQLAAGWELAFAIEVHDDQVQPNVAEEILREAGRAVGIGDYRPRYGRFEVVTFDVQ